MFFWQMVEALWSGIKIGIHAVLSVLPIYQQLSGFEDYIRAAVFGVPVIIISIISVIITIRKIVCKKINKTFCFIFNHSRRLLMNFDNIQAIRILPNDKKTFPTEQDFKFFITKTMVERGGIYYFPNLMMRTAPNTLVLFQYDGMIRAVGVLLESTKKSVINEFGEKHAGYYKFDIKTLKYLNKPIGAETLKSIIPSFKGFNQSKQVISIAFFEHILSLI